MKMRLMCGLLAGILPAGVVAAPAGKVRSRTRLETQDLKTTRADGRFENHAAFARDYVRRMVPEYSFDKVTKAEELPAWRAKVRTKLGELLQIPDPLPRLEFKLLSEEKRLGYRLYRYEFYPEERLVVPILLLVPEKVIEERRKVPAVVCMPGSGASLLSLAGEPEEFGNHYPARNRQAWHVAQIGMIGVAIENPGTAESGVREVNHFVTQQQFARFMTLAGRSNWGWMVEHVLETIDFLKTHPNVDPKKIAVSGMSLGCIPALYSAVMSDDVAAVVYNDFVSSWAANAVSVTKPVGNVDNRRPFGFHRWFDDEPDLMAAVAPRPMIFTEGGAWKGVIEKVQRAYALAGAKDSLEIAYYKKFADPASRKYEDVDLHQAEGLTDNDYLLFSNVDAIEHSFHPDVNLPWLAKTFFGTADFPPEVRREIAASVASPEWQYRPLDAGATYAQKKAAALAKRRLIIWDDDGCDMTHYPYQRPDLAKQPASVRNFEQVFLEATENTQVDVIGYSGTMGFGFFTQLRTGGYVNTNRFAEAHEPWRNAVNEFKALGQDSMDMATAFARRHGREIFLSLRFNDNHDAGSTLEKPNCLFSPFKMQNPETMVGWQRKVRCCGPNAADFAQEKVRTFAKTYIRNYLENYDLDGIEFDFFRHPQLFRTVAMGGHATPAELNLMTQLMKDFRAMAEEVGRKRGRPFVLGARVPDSFDYCRAIGIDLDAWLRAGTLDFVVVGGYFQLEPWRTSAEKIHSYGVKCYASLDETRIGRVKGSRLLPGRNGVDCWTARIAAAMASGMDGVNLFNIEYFNHDDQRRIMNRDIRDLEGCDKLYFATYVGGGGYLPQSFLVDGTNYLKKTGLNPAQAISLAKGSCHSFEFICGDDFVVAEKRGLAPQIELLLLTDRKEGGRPVISLNGRNLAGGTRVDDLIVHDLDPRQFVKGVNAVTITAAESMVLHDFAVRVRFRTKGAPAAASAFGRLPRGAFEVARTPLGVWKAASGHAEVYVQESDPTQRAIRLMGGKNTRLLLELPQPAASDALKLKAERFTGRMPYEVRIEARTEDGVWHDVAAETPSCPTKARRPLILKKLDRPVTAYRFTGNTVAGMLLWE